jgi:hypothetical protein
MFHWQDPARRRWRLALACLAPLFLIGNGSANKPATSETPGKPVQVQMRSVRYHYNDQVFVSIRMMRGELRPNGPLPVFDDKQSFKLHISTGEIAISTASLAAVLNTHVLASPDAPVKDVSVTIDHGKLKVKGKLHSKGDIPFETEGTLTSTADGKVRLHGEKIRALKLPVKGLMDLFGIKISDLIKSGKVSGLSAEGDDLLLDPQQILPPPQIEGKVVKVRLEGDQIIQVFGGEQREFLHVAFPNYMAYWGNELRFGKLTMHDVDMTLIDMDPKDPFDFSLDLYKKMLSAGYTKITPRFGLQVFMRDVNKLPRSGEAPSRKPRP